MKHGNIEIFPRLDPEDVKVTKNINTASNRNETW